MYVLSFYVPKYRFLCSGLAISSVLYSSYMFYMENTLPGQFSLHTSYRKTDDCVKIRKKNCMLHTGIADQS
jgi:hypothetical protein